MEFPYEYDVYLAGPFFTDEQKATMDAAKALLLTYNVKVCDPRELSPVITDMDPELRKAALFKGIFDGNIEGMMKSWAIFACIDDRDTGTSFELGFVYALNMFRSRMHEFNARTMGRRGPVITFSNKGFGCNVMLSQAADGHYASLADLDQDLGWLCDEVFKRTDGDIIKYHNFAPVTE